MVTQSTRTAVSELAPTSDELTDYDRAHITTYVRLLDAVGAGAEWTEVARIVLGFDAEHDAGRSRRAYDSHLARARWIAKSGYRDLLSLSNG